MKNIKKLLMVAAFLFGGYAVAAEQATFAVDAVASEQTCVQGGSDKVAELEALVQKVLDFQKPSNAKRAGFVALKEVAKIAGSVVCAELTAYYPKVHVLSLGVLCLLIDRYFYAKDKSVDMLNDLEQRISALSSEQKEKFVSLHKEKYELLLEKFNKEKNIKLDLGGNFAISVLDLMIFCLCNNWAQFYEPITLMQEFMKGLKEVLFYDHEELKRDFLNKKGVYMRAYRFPQKNKVTITSEATYKSDASGYVEYVPDEDMCYRLFSKHHRLYIGLHCLLLVLYFYQLGSNLYHNPSAEKSRALARIQKMLNA